MIIDDSGSTAWNDPARLRAKTLSLFIAKQIARQQKSGFPRRVISAIEFGGSASALFGPTPITSSTQLFMQRTVDAAIQADNGSTDYNAAFAFDNALNPTHDARIFFTDGEHNAGPFENGHLPGPRTEVLGLNVSDPTLLDRIAVETGGKHRPLVDPAQAVADIEDVFAAISCTPFPLQRKRVPPPPGRTKAVLSVPLSKRDRTVDLTIVTGESRSDDFQLLIKDKNNFVHRIRPRPVRGRPDESRCVTKVKSRVRGAKRRRARRRPALKVLCWADPSFVTINLTGRRGSSAKAAIGKRLVARVRTDRDALLPSDSELIVSFTGDR